MASPWGPGPALRQADGRQQPRPVPALTADPPARPPLRIPGFGVIPGPRAHLLPSRTPSFSQGPSTPRVETEPPLGKQAAGKCQGRRAGHLTHSPSRAQPRGPGSSASSSAQRGSGRGGLSGDLDSSRVHTSRDSRSM